MASGKRQEGEDFHAYRLRLKLEQTILKKKRAFRNLVVPMAQSLRQVRAEYLQAKKLFKRGTFQPPMGTELEARLYAEVRGSLPPNHGLTLIPEPA